MIKCSLKPNFVEKLIRSKEVFLEFRILQTSKLISGNEKDFKFIELVLFLSQIYKIVYTSYVNIDRYILTQLEVCRTEWHNYYLSYISAMSLSYVNH